MSTINEALKKAQKEKDTHFHKYSGSLSARGRGHGLFPRETFLWTVLILAGVSLAVAAYWRWDVADPNSPPRPENGNKKKAIIAQSIQPPQPKQPKVVVDAKVSYEKARVFQRNGSLKDAGRLYRESLRADPGYVDALNNLGVVYIQEKDYLAAQISFEKAILLKPEYVDPYYNLACLYALKGVTKESIVYLKKAISLDQSVKSWARGDADLENLRDQPEFKKIIGANGSTGGFPETQKKETGEIEKQREHENE